MEQRREICFGCNGMKVNIISEGNDCVMDLSVKMDSTLKGTTDDHVDNKVGVILRIGGPHEAADDTKEEKKMDKKIVTGDDALQAGESAGNDHKDEEDDIVFVELLEEASIQAGESAGNDHKDEEDDTVFVELLEEAFANNSNVNVLDDWVLL